MDGFGGDSWYRNAEWDCSASDKNRHHFPENGPRLKNGNVLGWGIPVSWLPRLLPDVVMLAGKLQHELGNRNHSQGLKVPYQLRIHGLTAPNPVL